LTDIAQSLGAPLLVVRRPPETKLFFLGGGTDDTNMESGRNGGPWANRLSRRHRPAYARMSVLRVNARPQHELLGGRASLKSRVSAYK
jgi:hypothetical protein